MPGLDAVVGLGNPGSRYRNSYHNLGFWAIDTLVNSFPTDGVATDEGELFRNSDSPPSFFGKPGRYVNRSGEVILRWSEEFDWSASKILVVYDDFSLDVGEVRVRPSGSAGGHNGLNSILDSLRTREVPRLRIGIGPLPGGMDPADFVLAEITQSDREVYRNLLEKLPDLIHNLDSQSWEEVMSEWNGRNFTDDPDS